MAVGLKPPSTILPVAGIKLSAIHCGIKSDIAKTDLVLFELEKNCNLSAVFTRNRFCAAPVVVAKEHLLKNPTPRYLLVNSGNANAGTGVSGIQNAKYSCQLVAQHFATDENAVLPFSTGVIATELAVEKIKQSMPDLVGRLDEDHWLEAAEGIKTTDTVAKAISKQVEIDGKTVTISGIAKGSGMIRPDMATMLAYIATDALIKPEVLDQYLKQCIEVSFNAITVDGDTSTNDSCVLMATGQSNCEIEVDNALFSKTLTEVFQHLAQAIIRDGEGASKFVEVQVNTAATLEDAKSVAYTIAHSPLVKTALFASDPNWGRILAAIGRAEVELLEIEKISLYLGDVCLIENGLPHAAYSEQQGQQEMDKSDIVIRVELGQGNVQTRIWTTDLSYDYVRINAEYRS